MMSLAMRPGTDWRTVSPNMPSPARLALRLCVSPVAGAGVAHIAHALQMLGCGQLPAGTWAGLCAMARGMLP